MISKATSLLALCLFACLAQEPAELFEKAPPDIDEALRARISSFYQAHVDGKFRDAYELVAEDSRDIFLVAEKPKYLGFKVVNITYSEDFRRAKALVACDREMSAMPLPVKAPVVSTWKLVDGQWYWYANPRQQPETAAEAPLEGPLAKPGLAALAMRAPSVAALQQMVKAEKSEVRLPRDGPGEDQVRIFNPLPGSVYLSVPSQSLPGLQIKLEHRELKAKETGVVSFHYEPADEPPRQPLTVNILVEPTSQILPIRITFFESSAPPTAPSK